MDSQYIVGQTNSLARMFYAALGFSFDVDVDFRNSKVPYKKKCWDMAVIAQRELSGVNVADYLEESIITASDFNSRVLAASSDGVLIGGQHATSNNK